MPTNRENNEWAFRFFPAIQKIIGQFTTRIANPYRDTKEATDLVMIYADLSIAIRMRRHEYVTRYSKEWTFRSRLASGTKTELQKIIEGWADWMFYGFATAKGYEQVSPWHIIDLHAFRANLIRNNRLLERHEYDNHDGTFFKVFRLSEFRKSDPPVVMHTSTTVREPLLFR